MTTIRSHAAATVALSTTDIPALLTRMAFGGSTSQFSLSAGDLRYVVHLPFTQGGGPLHFDLLVFGSTGSGPLRYVGSVDNDFVQGVSGHTHVGTAAGRAAIIADSGKEWLSWVTAAFAGTGFASMAEPPQDYGRWPLGYLVRLDATAQAPYLLPTRLTDLRAFNHSVAAGDVNGDGLVDYLVAGSSKQEDPLFYARLGYLLVSQPSGGHQRILIDHPNLSATGVAKGGLGNVVLADLDGDRRDEIVLSGGSPELAASDKGVLTLAFRDGRLVEQFSLAPYGRFNQHPSYNHYAFDMDKDGDLDILAFFGVSSWGFELLRNDGNGRLTPLPDAAGLNALRLQGFKMMQFADANRDGYTDIILDNLTSDWSLATRPGNLASAILLNDAGRGFKPASTAPVLAGSTPGASVRTLVTSYAGEIAPGTHRFVTSFLRNNDAEFGMFAQDIALPAPGSGGGSAVGAPTVASVLLTTGQAGIYLSSAKSLALAASGLRAGDALTDAVILQTAAGKPLAALRQPAAVSVADDGGIRVFSGSGSQWTEQAFAASGLAQGAAQRQTLPALLQREAALGIDINRDGRIGQTVAAVLDGDGYPDAAGSAALGLYRTALGTLVLDRAGLAAGSAIDAAALPLATAAARPWTLRGNEQAIALARIDGERLELLVRSGSRHTAHIIDDDSGVVSARATPLRDTGALRAREFAYGLDLDGDGQVSLVGQATPPPGWPA